MMPKLTRSMSGKMGFHALCSFLRNAGCSDVHGLRLGAVDEARKCAVAFNYKGFECARRRARRLLNDVCLLKGHIPMTHTKLFFTTLTTCTLLTLPLAAQETALESATPVQSAPQVRVDIQLPSVGVVGTTAQGSAAQAGVGIRVGHQSGHGVRFDLLAWDDLRLFASGAYATSFDLSYFYRLRLAGDDRLGMGIDLGGGLSVQDIHFSRASSWGEPAPEITETIADGAHLGGVLIAALDGRAYGFTFGIDVRAHSVFALQGAPGDSSMQADLSLNTSLGFGFY